MRKSFAIAVGASALLIGSLAGNAGAQSTQTTQTTQTTRTTATGDVIGPHNPYCGAWVDGAFQANGNCVTETTTTTTTTQAQPAPAAGTAVVVSVPAGRVFERISGQITKVDGHLLTLQHGDSTLIVDDSRALDRELTGHVAQGRMIVAHGYWDGDTFFANRFD